jgi:hypothetical protein
MMLQQLKPALQYSEGRSRPWSGAKIVNCFSEKADGDKQQDFALMLIPGLDLFAYIASGLKVRGLHFMGSTLYAVVGSTLYTVSQAGMATAIGTVVGSNRVQIVDNGTQLAICAAPMGYVLSGGILATPVNLPSVSSVAYIDGYFVWSIDGTDQAIFSGINDGTSYDPLDTFAAEGSPDGLLGILNSHRELLMLGSDTIEIFYDSGDADNPFQRQGNAFIERGVFTRDSAVKIDNAVNFLGDDRIVYRLDGYTPIRISTHAIEYHLRNITDAWGFAYTQEGHKFYVLNTDQGCWSYDLATGAWHERLSSGRANYRAGCAETAWGRTVFGDNETGNLYTPSLDNYTENGDPISCQIELPSIGDGSVRRTMYMFQLYCETGVGLNTGQGSDPQVMLTYSDNGGRAFSNEMWRSLGAIGEYRTRAIWRGLGQFRQRQMRLVMTDPVRRFIIAYFADVR